MTRPRPAPPSPKAPPFHLRLLGRLGLTGFAACSLASVGLVTATAVWLIMTRVDRGLRADLLRQARAVAFALDPEYLESLEGAEPDTARPAYRALKSRLARTRAADPCYRFVYFMGQRDGAVFFFIDSEPAGSPDESPPGQVYTEASPELLAVFRTGREAVAGPWKDRWGTWVSAFVPLRVGERTVVMGMDIDARGWQRLVVAGGALPALLVVFASGLVLTLLRLRRLSVRTAASQRKIESILRGSPIGIGVAVDRVFIEVNDRFCELAGLSRDQIVGRTTRILYPDDAEYERVGRELYEPVTHGEVAAMEARVRRGDGEIRDALITAAALVRDHPEQGIAFAVVDITERRRAEEALRAALKEKEILLREVHHRVKNNLQAVVALIGMRMAGLTDESVVRSLDELQEQVRAMALVYEQVYRAGGSGETPMDTYLGAIVRGLMDAMGDGRVKAELSVPPLVLPMGKAMACGLIVTELVTNAFKHAFRDGRPNGRIEVGLRCEGETYELWVADDGVGFCPGEGLDSPSASGLQMVRLWATHQLAGTVEVSGPPGSRITVRFPE